MGNSTVARLLLLGIATGLTGCMYEPTYYGDAGGSGFVQAYFDEPTLVDLMESDDCAALRFYTIKRTADDRSGSVMVISTNSKGRELYSYFLGPWYKAYEELSGENARTRSLDREQATDATDHMRGAGFVPMAADFSTKEVQNLLDVADCNGVQLVAERVDAMWSMRMVPVKIAKGAASVVGVESDTRICTEPCPTYCGEMPGMYLYRE